VRLARDQGRVGNNCKKKAAPLDAACSDIWSQDRLTLTLLIAATLLATFLLLLALSLAVFLFLSLLTALITMAALLTVLLSTLAALLATLAALLVLLVLVLLVWHFIYSLYEWRKRSPGRLSSSRERFFASRLKNCSPALLNSRAAARAFGFET
jgi:hypothetical protein